MKYKKMYFPIALIAILVIGCKSADTITSSEADNIAYNNLLSLIESQSFQIDIQSAEPFNTLASAQVINDILVPQTGSNASRINVNADANNFVMNNGMAKGHMPFFGELRMGSGHYGNSDSGINIDGEPTKLSIQPNKKKKKVVMKFNVSDSENNSSENYNVTLTAFPSGNAQMVFVSTHRTLIRYNGLLKPLDEDIE